MLLGRLFPFCHSCCSSVTSAPARWWQQNTQHSVGFPLMLSSLSFRRIQDRKCSTHSSYSSMEFLLLLPTQTTLRAKERVGHLNTQEQHPSPHLFMGVYTPEAPQKAGPTGHCTSTLALLFPRIRERLLLRQARCPFSLPLGKASCHPAHVVQPAPHWPHLRQPPVWTRAPQRAAPLNSAGCVCPDVKATALSPAFTCEGYPAHLAHITCGLREEGEEERKPKLPAGQILLCLQDTPTARTLSHTLTTVSPPPAP